MIFCMDLDIYVYILFMVLYDVECNFRTFFGHCSVGEITWPDIIIKSVFLENYSVGKLKGSIDKRDVVKNKFRFDNIGYMFILM